MKKRQVLQIAATALVDKPASRRIAIEEVNRGGLEGLYRILLDDSSQELVAVLRHIKASVASERPVLFFCKAGKDRTGLVAALLLSILGASEEDILQDYVISDRYHMVALAGLEENPKVTGLDRAKFERAPREAMHHALQYIKEQYGGAQQYLVKAGFSPAEQEELQQLLLVPADVNEDSVPGSDTGHSRL
jgi:protein tyrosine/serine phosphatase